VLWSTALSILPNRRAKNNYKPPSPLLTITHFEQAGICKGLLDSGFTIIELSTCSVENNANCHFERAEGESRNPFFNRFLHSVPTSRDSGRNDDWSFLQSTFNDQWNELGYISRCLSFPRNLSSRKRGAGIQPFYDSFLDSCFRRSDISFVPLLIQTSIIRGQLQP
jgi:hypothetical protein